MGCGRKSKAHKNAKAELLRIQDRALHIVDQVLLCICESCEDFCYESGIRQANVMSCSAAAFMCSRLKPLSCPGLAYDWVGCSRIVEYVVPTMQNGFGGRTKVRCMPTEFRA